MIPQRNISLISNTLVTAGGRRIPEAVIERDYVLAWFLTGLAGHPLRDVLAFKGGTALRRCWFEDYRFSEDLDFTPTHPITLEEILAGLKSSRRSKPPAVFASPSIARKYRSLASYAASGSAPLGGTIGGIRRNGSRILTVVPVPIDPDRAIVPPS